MTDCSTPVEALRSTSTVASTILPPALIRALRASFTSLVSVWATAISTAEPDAFGRERRTGSSDGIAADGINFTHASARAARAFTAVASARSSAFTASQEASASAAPFVTPSWKALRGDEEHGAPCRPSSHS